MWWPYFKFELWDGIPPTLRCQSIASTVSTELTAVIATVVLTHPHMENFVCGPHRGGAKLLNLVMAPPCSCSLPLTVISSSPLTFCYVAMGEVIQALSGFQRVRDQLLPTGTLCYSMTSPYIEWLFLVPAQRESQQIHIATEP